MGDRRSGMGGGGAGHDGGLAALSGRRTAHDQRRADRLLRLGLQLLQGRAEGRSGLPQQGGGLAHEPRAAHGLSRQARSRARSAAAMDGQAAVAAGTRRLHHDLDGLLDRVLRRLVGSGRAGDGGTDRAVCRLWSGGSRRSGARCCWPCCPRSCWWRYSSVGCARLEPPLGGRAEFGREATVPDRRHHGSGQHLAGRRRLRGVFR